MAHDCLTYWGNQVSALVARLDEGDRKSGGGGWAARLAEKEEYDALLRLKDSLLAARDLKIGELPDWKRGKVRVAGLLEATLNVAAGLDVDRLSTSSGRHDPAGKYWHMTGSPDPDASYEMGTVLWPKVRNALGG